jgi:hypothetical protein
LANWDTIEDKFQARAAEIESIDVLKLNETYERCPNPKHYAGPGPEMNTNLLCGICDLVAWDPVQCDGEDDCDILYCRSCIYNTQSGNCPKCEYKFPEGVKLNRILRQLYEE